MNTFWLVRYLAARFTAHGIDNAKHVAEEVIAHQLKCKPLEIYQRNVDHPSQHLENLALRIESGEPLQYVIGETDFYGFPFTCDRRALIPRPETELLIDTVLNAPVWTANPTHVIDIGTGSGCIAITLALHRPAATIEAVDTSAGALELARENAARNGVQHRIIWHHSTLLKNREDNRYHVVVSNPPYIATANWKRLAPAVRNHEPRCALDTGPDGLECIDQLAQEAFGTMKKGGMLALEIGYDQGPATQQIMVRSGYCAVETKKDLHGHDRIVHAIKP